MSFGTKLVLNSKFKSLNKLLAAGKYDEALAKLEDISDSLSISFVDPKNKNSIMTLLLNSCLPLISHENPEIHTCAQNILNHWSSIVSSFYPKAFLDAFSNIDVSQLKSESCSAIFSFFSNALRCIHQDNRNEYLNILKSLLHSSKPELLVGISINIWSFLRDPLTISDINSILQLFMNSSLAEEAAFLCEKSPDPLYNTILEKANFEFIKKTLQYWPLTKQVNLSILAPRLITAFENNDSSEISITIEILNQLVQRVNKLSEIDYEEQWEQLITHCQKLFESSATIEQKASLIDLFSSASFIPKSSLEHLLIFEQNIPTPIKISIMKLCSHFICEGKLPKGLLEFIDEQVVQRDPLVFVSILDFLSISFNDLHKLSPQPIENILNHSLTPLSQSPVEQISILRLLQSIDYKNTGVNIDIVSIVLNLLDNPDQSLFPELKKTIIKLKLELPLRQLNWTRDTAMLLQVIPKVHSSFINELFEIGKITPSTFPSAVNAIMNNFPDDETADDFAKSVLSVIAIAFAEIGLDYSRKLKHWFINNWRYFTNQINESVKDINKNLKQTDYGNILLYSLQLFVKCMNDGYYGFQYIEALYSLAIDIAPAFCDEACKIVVFLHKIFRESKDYSDKKKKKRVDELITLFFSQSLPFDCSKEIAKAAMECLPRENVMKCIPNYLVESILISPEILQWYLSGDSNEMPPISPVFIQIEDKDEKTHNYINQCVKDLLFNEWKLTDNSGEKIEKMQGIVVQSYYQLDYTHRKFVDQYPSSFVIQQQKKEKHDINIKIDIKASSILS
ncbi:hypothetical protein TVAG_294870 [Trichomonas vaginalis G3]|uniref:Uncharacterized protein n=1 Tax=Trichomonas vaginalis (strain ATCC PRA-98 / G3) TaxID=412133 RepID=A2DL45_TRIV3|nr:armadillo (ARM) repeat-containing protein family [Trichomonas vaginalis G3]EAY18836.1 hypothetical protein TVAG_294870 [Trichomonas vaginalis G3]KAI5526058.1 armadillo (ARM) repeat-containing protein family [Trichomonas vaginalis G3]|eukprot:XP_001579822.1 hypothetical protein [Trichomonas vaginalis G3]